MYWSSILSCIALAGVEARYVLHEKRQNGDHAPGWRQINRVHSSAIVPLRIGLTQSNLKLGEQRLRAVSDPTSEQYGRHLSLEQVHDLFAPPLNAVESVRQWLIESGIANSSIVHSDNRGWIAANVPASTTEMLFRSQLYEYESSTTGQIHIGCDKYHVPDHLTHHIDYITPGVKMSAPLKKSAKGKRAMKRSLLSASPRHDGSHPRGLPNSNLPENVQNCSMNWTVPCWRYKYQLPFPHINDSVNTLGIFEQGDSFRLSSIHKWFAKYAPYVPANYSPTVLSIDGADGPAVPGDVLGEADIDVDITTALIYPQSVTVYQVDDSHIAYQELSKHTTFNTFLDAIDGSYCNYTAYNITGDTPSIDGTYPDPDGYTGQLQCGVYKPTRVISISYIPIEIEFPKNYLLRQCNEFLKLGLQGVTVIVASGDHGVGGTPGFPTTSGCLGANGTVFNPGYPSSCPWVTSVGGTQIYPNQTINDPESVLAPSLSNDPNFSSGGGFSNYFSRPDYQLAAVAEWDAFFSPKYPSYIANADASNLGAGGGMYNRAGRAYPDMAAAGSHVPLIYHDGEVEVFYYGTSNSAPVVASTITLINQQRTLIGKGPVGFLNYALYANPFVLTDITHGSQAENCHSAGFAATPGWDPSTGLGTPNYPRMLEYFLSLP